MAENYRRQGKRLSLSSTNVNVRSLSVVAIWNHIGKSVVRPLLFLKRLFFSGRAFLIFLLPSYYPSFFFLFPLLSQCDRCPDVPVWVASQGTILLSRGWLITVEVPGHPRHPPSTQLDAVVNKSLLPRSGEYSGSFQFFYFTSIKLLSNWNRVSVTVKPYLYFSCA